MEAKGETQWSSIIVPSGQEMVKEKMITTVPSRYVRSDQDKTQVADDSGLITEMIPIIDMKQLSCKPWNRPKFLGQSQRFKISSTFPWKRRSCGSNQMRWNVSDKLFVVSEDQKFDWADLFLIIMQPVQLRKPHLFPNLPLPLRDTLEMYSAQVKSIAKVLIAKMAKSLQIKPEEIEEIFGDDMLQSIRMNYYPPCPQPDKVVGLTPHSDAAGVTMLLQVNEVDGLQIKKDGKWVFVKPLPNAFIVNVGDVFEIISNGTYKSIEHRAVVNSEKERLSIGTFHNPGLNKEIAPARSLVEKEKKGAHFRSLIARLFRRLLLP